MLEDANALAPSIWNLMAQLPALSIVVVFLYYHMRGATAERQQALADWLKSLDSLRKSSEASSAATVASLEALTHANAESNERILAALSALQLEISSLQRAIVTDIQKKPRARRAT